MVLGHPVHGNQQKGAGAAPLIAVAGVSLQDLQDTGRQVALEKGRPTKLMTVGNARDTRMTKTVVLERVLCMGGAREITRNAIERPSALRPRLSFDDNLAHNSLLRRLQLSKWHHIGQFSIQDGAEVMAGLRMRTRAADNDPTLPCAQTSQCSQIAREGANSFI